jgi:hypothetical protein
MTEPRHADLMIEMMRESTAAAMTHFTDYLDDPERAEAIP